MLDDCETWAVVGLSGNPSPDGVRDRAAAPAARQADRADPPRRHRPCWASRATPRSPTCRSRSTSWTCSGGRRSPASSPTRPSRSAPAAVWFQLGVHRRGRRSSAPGGRRADGDGHLPGHRVAPARGMSTPGSDLERAVRARPARAAWSIPAAELVERFSRSPGPGGQSVNTDRQPGRAGVRRRLVGGAHRRPARPGAAQPRHRLVDGRVVVDASEHRSQHRNRVAARERLAELLRAALAPTAPAAPSDQAVEGLPAAPAGGQEAARPDQGAPRPGRVATDSPRRSGRRPSVEGDRDVVDDRVSAVPRDSSEALPEQGGRRPTRAGRADRRPRRARRSPAAR